MFFFPYRIDSVFKHWPVANWGIMAATLVMFFVSGSLADETLHRLVLGGTSVAGLVGHLGLHAGYLHLGGNLLFLWVFGNAVCAMTSSLLYPVIYVVFGVIAAAVHLAFDGSPAIGASGAINGVVGLAFVLYPRNYVSVFWFFVVRAGTIDLPLWSLVVVWLAFDAIGAWSGHGDVAYWAHLGGFATGVVAGIIALKLRWITMTAYDNPSLVNPGESPESKQARDRAWERALYSRD